MIKAPYVPYSKDSSKAAIYLYSAEGLAVTEKHIYVADTKHSRGKINKNTLEVEEVFLHRTIRLLPIRRFGNPGRNPQNRLPSFEDCRQQY